MQCKQLKTHDEQNFEQIHILSKTVDFSYLCLIGHIIQSDNARHHNSISPKIRAAKLVRICISFSIHDYVGFANA